MDNRYHQVRRICIAVLLAAIFVLRPAFSDEVEPVGQCDRDFLSDISRKCGPYADDPNDWYNPSNECTIKAQEAFTLCKENGYEARFVLVRCGTPPNHALVECKINGQWVFIDTSVESFLRSIILPAEVITLPEFKADPPFTSLLKKDGETPIDEFACFLAGRDPQACCKIDPKTLKSTCDCSATVTPEPPASAAQTPQVCATTELTQGGGFEISDCLSCCDTRYTFLSNIEKGVCNDFVRHCGADLGDNLKLGFDNPLGGLSSEMLYLGLITAWRCDQWPKQAIAWRDSCKASCRSSDAKLSTLTLEPRSTPSIPGLGAIEAQAVALEGASRCSIPNKCAVKFPKSGRVKLTARPRSPDAQFVSWAGGGCKGTQPVCFVSANANQTVVANFKKSCARIDETAASAGGQCCPGLKKCATGTCRPSCEVKLNVQVQGAGLVEGGPINCPRRCSSQVPWSNTPVQLFATSLAGSEFNGWTGPCLKNDPPNPFLCSVLPQSSSLEVTASFKKQCASRCSTAQCGDDGCGGSCGSCQEGQICDLGECTSRPTLSVSITSGGSGSGSVRFSDGSSCSKSCEKTFYPGVEVTLTAEPSAGSSFGGWSGGCSGNFLCTLIMSTSQRITARFDRACQSDCGSRQCGVNSCGKSCGTCPNGYSCNQLGACEKPPACSPRCQGLTCGSDGCGGTCGTCSVGQECVAGNCISQSACVPVCGPKPCGAPDGCGGFCNTACPNPTVIF